MCLIFLSYRQNRTYPLVLAANRDEFYHRPSLAAHYWQDYPQVLGGLDLEQGGTWLGVSRSGRIAAVTNIRNPAKTKVHAQSRGKITRSYLTSEESSEQFGEKLLSAANQYNGFNLLFGHIDRLHFCSSEHPVISTLQPGCYGLSNADLNTPWPKVRDGTKRFASLTANRLDRDGIMELLADRTLAPDEQLPDTGVCIEIERMLSSKFIVSPDYGTRASTLISVTDRGEVELIEQTYLENGTKGGRVQFNFKLDGGPR